MVNTFLGPAQAALRDQYRQFAKELIATCVTSCNQENGSHKTSECSEMEHSAQHTELQGIEHKGSQLRRQLADKGYLGITVPEEFGGQTGSILDVVLFVEAVSEYEPGLALSLSNHYAVIELLLEFGSTAQKSKFLPLLASGETLGAIAFGEENAGSDLTRISTRAIDQSGKVVVTGKKTFVANASQNCLLALLVKDGESESFSVYLVESKEQSNLSISKRRIGLGLRSAQIADVEFRATAVLAEMKLSDSSNTKAIELAQNIAKVILAAGAIGLLEGCVSGSVTHARERQQFDQAISQFQAIQWKLADMSADSAAARLITYQAAWSKDGNPTEFPRLAAMSKFLAAKAARLHSAEYVQIMGVSGLERDSQPERFYNDAKAMEILEGTAEIQKSIIASELGVHK